MLEYTIIKVVVRLERIHPTVPIDDSWTGLIVRDIK